MKAIYKYILPGLLLVLSITSCKKGWLDVTSNTEVRSEEQFKNEAGFRDALMGVYIGMTDPSLYSRDMTWNLVDLLSQQYNTLPGLAIYAEVPQYKYKTARTMPKVDALWNKSYNVIANINNALAATEQYRQVLSHINYSIIRGELLGLRAFLHFDLMRLYGYGNIANRPELAGKPAIPYVSKFSKEITPQLSYQETFALLKKDIQEALVLLQEDPVYPNPGRPANYYDEVNRNGFYSNRELRMNYYAVKALLARVLIWQGGADNLAAARTAAEEVINSAPARLITAATSPSSDRIFYSEHLFSLNIAAFENIVNPYLNAQQSTNYDALYLLPQKAQELYETQNVNIGVADIRYNRLLESQTQGLVPVKLYQRSPGIKNVMPLMKIPEMYYIAAEYYLGADLSKAIEYLNTVRASRGIIQAIPASADAATVSNELFKEYRKEFLSEGQLFFYYKRLGKTTFPGFPAGTTADDKIYLLPYPDNEVEFGNRIQ